MMNLSPQGRGLQFKLGSIPVSFDPTMLIFVAAISFTSRDKAAVFVAFSALFFSVLIHELGHAVAFLRQGMAPAIRLHLFGGVTTAAGELEWKERIGVSLAGPFAGFFLGAIVLAVDWYGYAPDTGLGEVAVRWLILANLLWGAINLLPMLPLDGGHVFEALLVHFRGEAGWRFVRIVSIVIGLIAGTISFVIGYVFAAMLAGYFAWGSWRDLAGRESNKILGMIAQARADQRDGNHRAVVQTTFDALGSKPSQDQKRWLWALRTVSLFELGRPQQAHDEIAPVARAERSFWAWAAVEQEVGSAAGARDALLDTLRSGEPMWPGLWERVKVDPDSIESIVDDLITEQPSLAGQGLDTLQRLMARHGDHDSSIRVGSHAWDIARPPAAAVEIACSYIYLNDGEMAQFWLERAVGAGFDDLELMQTDPVLAPLRDSPAFQALLRQIAAG